ncbi:unnamed protein product [Cuscuta campestris]|uniref:RRM domain-containing protein n=2 Tax=Cuscuta campestris TaxID=132261 RepID=A0A484KCU9_9ASTE|nr:unnamed protein product [Cuscuta campestris]
MADYWRYGDVRPPAVAIPPVLAKRPRSEYDPTSGHDLHGYYAGDDGRGVHRVIRDTDPLGASYDRYLQGAMSAYGVGEPARSLGGAIGGHPGEDPRALGIVGPDPMSAKARAMGVVGGVGRTEIPLPPDASSTLYVEGLPSNCTRREVSHIFRPFVGYKEVRLVTKDSRRPDGEPLVFCFVDFATPAHAATAKEALQGYLFDELERDSVTLRLQFSRHPGARPGGGPRGRR